MLTNLQRWAAVITQTIGQQDQVQADQLAAADAAGADGALAA